MASRKRAASQEERELVEKKRRLGCRLRLLRLHLQFLEDGTYNRAPTTPSAQTPGSTRSRRVVTKPQKFDEKGHDIKLSGALVKCRNIVNGLLQHKSCWIFAKPVDPTAWNIPDYPRVIKNPMDLGTVKENLTNGLYDTPEAFASDVRLVWSNAIKYNGEHSDVASIARELSGLFEDRLRKVKGHGQKSSQKFLKKTPLPREKSGSKKKKSKSKKKDAGDPYSEELKNLQKQMDGLRKQISKYSSSSSGTPAPKKSSGHRQSSMKSSGVPTAKEKQTLKDDIVDLEYEKLQEVINIISRRMPHLQSDDDDELEIDMDQLDTPTLRELQQFVRKCKGNKPKTLSPARFERHQSAPAPVPMKRDSDDSDSSSSDSDSSDSDSDSESSDEDSDSQPLGRVSNKQPRPAGKQPKTHAQPATSAIAPTEAGDAEDPQPVEDVKVNSDAWSNFATEEKQNGGKDDSKDEGWSDWQKKNQEMKQKREEEERLAKEAAKQRELEYNRKKRNDEEAEKLVAQRRKEEDERLKKEAEEQRKLEQREMEARREAARKAREASLAEDDLDRQRAALGSGFATHGSMADFDIRS
mmetsp:Transcript_26389/g.63656  ORF Transcript_26389/g.63656 Transcript_26389/m.63656 type:complete len:581 (-) Transcript_26389:277-2019(-)|eukprot:CAMPEP_0114522250 /NCGR_PEP_ID=MMETSP0109-20121206/20642_1 /TAXON_ID=29199 /ORGANISM="Chlorarachnion reptans, Strain CCCM449" /LENGTH=580 /DNA_ID=CAMNT_0001703455 /DNA_START=147 /DNA_END=1889 /DNA_ORIENTATION=-